jgi:hypothetical protein
MMNLHINKKFMFLFISPLLKGVRGLFFNKIDLKYPPPNTRFTRLDSNPMFMVKTLYTIFILIFFLLSMLYGQKTKYGGAFLELGVGPRALALGGANVALADDGYGSYWNPAGVAFTSQLQIATMYANLFNSLEKHSFVSISTPILGGVVVSGSWIRLAVDDIPIYYDRDLDNTTLDQRLNSPGLFLDNPASGSFSFTNDAYFITVSRFTRWEADLGWQYFELPIDIGYGVNFKIIDISLYDKSASAVGIDGGVKVRVGLDDLMNDEAYGKLSIGLCVQDIFNTRISWNTDTKQQDLIARNWRYGFAYLQPLHFINGQLALVYDINSRYDGSAHFGFEFVFKSLLALRIGSNSGNFTTGAGLSYWNIHLDYAYQSHDLGNSHRVGLSVGF